MLAALLKPAKAQGALRGDGIDFGIVAEKMDRHPLCSGQRISGCEWQEEKNFLLIENSFICMKD